MMFIHPSQTSTFYFSFNLLFIVHLLLIIPTHSTFDIYFVFLRVSPTTQESPTCSTFYLSFTYKVVILSPTHDPPTLSLML